MHSRDEDKAVLFSRFPNSFYGGNLRNGNVTVATVRKNWLNHWNNFVQEIFIRNKIRNWFVSRNATVENSTASSSHYRYLKKLNLTEFHYINSISEIYNELDAMTFESVLLKNLLQ